VKKSDGEAGRLPLSDAPGSFNYSYLVTKDGLVVEDPSETFLHLTGYTLDDLQGADPWVAFVHPDDRDQAHEIITQLQSGHGWNGTFRIITKHKHVRLMHLSNRAEFDAEGRVVRIVGQGVDLTEHERLRAALAEKDVALRLVSSQVPMIMWSTDEELVFTSSTGPGLTGLELSPNQVVGMSVFEFFGTTEDDFESIGASKRALEGEPTAFSLDWSGRRFRAIVEPVRGRDDQIIGTRGVAIDVTERFELENQVAELVRQVTVLRNELQDARRASTSDPEENEVIRHRELEIEPLNYVVRKRGEIVPLTPTEFQLLLELVTHKGRVLTRTMLVERVWGYDFNGDPAVVNMAVKRLREKIEDDPAHPSLVGTVRGVGYRLMEQS
jgi:PAS domain S-box-containing protein